MLDTKEQGILITLILAFIGFCATVIMGAGYWFSEHVWCPKCGLRLKWRSGASQKKVGSGKRLKDVTTTERVTYDSGRTKTIDRTTKKLVPYDVYSRRFVCTRCQCAWSAQVVADR